jgi:hypothetical protein
VTEIWNDIEQLLGGGTLTIWIIVGALVMLYVAWKAAKFAIRIFAAIIAIGLLLSTAPWSSEGLQIAETACISEIVNAQLTTWENIATKRITIDEVSPTINCNVSLGVDGSATVRLRTFYDIPFQTIEIVNGNITRSVDL